MESQQGRGSPPSETKHVGEIDTAYLSALAIRPTNQFCETIKNFKKEYHSIMLSHRASPAATVKQITAAVGNLFSLQKREDAIVVTMEKLRHATKMYQVHMLALESGRYGNEYEYSISEAQNDELVTAQAELTAAREALDELPKQYEEKKENINDEMKKISEEMLAHQTKKLQDSLAQQQERDTRRTKLTLDKSKDETARNTLQSKLDSACCHCCLPFCCKCCRPEKELKEKEVLEKKIGATELELENLITQGNPEEEKDEVLSRLQAKYESKRIENAQLIQEHPKKLNDAKERVIRAEANLASINQNIETEARHWYADLNRETMFFTLRVYHQFTQICALVQNKYQLARTDSSESKLFEQLNKLCLNYKTDINANFLHLFWCSESCDIQFSMVHATFTQCEEGRKQKILSEEVTDELLQFLLPKKRRVHERGNERT